MPLCLQAGSHKGKLRRRPSPELFPNSEAVTGEWSVDDGHGLCHCSLSCSTEAGHVTLLQIKQCPQSGLPVENCHNEQDNILFCKSQRRVPNSCFNIICIKIPRCKGAWGIHTL